MSHLHIFALDNTLNSALDYTFLALDNIVFLALGYASTAQDDIFLSLDNSCSKLDNLYLVLLTCPAK